MIDPAEPLHCRAPLDLEANPFSSYSDAPLVNSAQAALKEVVALIELRRRAILIVGKAGTGKTSLLRRVARACSDRGLSVCRFDRGDIAESAIDARSDVALVDEAASVPDSALLALFFSHSSTTWVFVCDPACVHRFGCLDADLVELRELSADDARSYIFERAASIGRPDLFAPDALDVIVHHARGSPGLLLSIASLAFLTAAWGGAAQIGVRHVAYWVMSQTPMDVTDDNRVARVEGFCGESADRSIPALIGDARRPIAVPLDLLSRARPLRFNRQTATIAASICLAGAVAAFLAGGNDASGGPSATVPIEPKQVVADASVAQPPTAAPADPDISANSGQDSFDSASVDAPIGRAAAASGKGAVGRAPGATKTSPPPAPVRTARSARAPRSAPPAVMNEAAQRARDSSYLTRVNEAARQARHAARIANEAAHRADQAAHRATLAALQAERAARQASWGSRLRFPWNATRAPRSAS